MATRPQSVGFSVSARDVLAALDRTGVRDLPGAVRRARNLRPFLESVVDPDVSALLAQQFAGRGARLRRGVRWARLRPSTVARKGHDTPLVDTGALRSAWTNPRDARAKVTITATSYARTVRGTHPGNGRRRRRAGSRPTMQQLSSWFETGTRGRTGMVARPITGHGVPAPVTRAWAGKLGEYIATGRMPSRAVSGR